MDKIILCFELKNCQNDFSNLMQVIQAFEIGNKNIPYDRILGKIVIKYCWIKEYANIAFSARELVQNIEERWYGDNTEKSIWNAHELTQLKEMVVQREKYMFHYYVRVKIEPDDNITSLRFLLLIIQQFPMIKGRIQVFIEPFEKYLSAGGEQWNEGTAYYKYSHYMRFVVQRYRDVFFGAFFHSMKNSVCIEQLSRKKPGVTSTFFPLLEVDGEINDIFSKYCSLHSDGTLAERGNRPVNPILKDLFEISSKILKKRIYNKENKCTKKEKKVLASRIYKNLESGSITALEYAIFSVLIPVSEDLKEEQIINYRRRAGSISTGLIQIIENIILHSINHKGIFTFRIIKEGGKYLNRILDCESGIESGRILEIDVADANIRETIVDNFLNKLESKDKYFSNIDLSVGQFFQEYQNGNEENAWKQYREQNPSKCMGLIRLKKELQMCSAVLQVRSSTLYNGEEKALIYKQNYYHLHGKNGSSFHDNSTEDFIPGAQFQIVFPEMYKEYSRQHNANIFLNCIGNLVENDEYYAGFIDCGLVSFNDYVKKAFTKEQMGEYVSVIRWLDSYFKRSIRTADSENNGKNQMVWMWKEEMNQWYSWVRLPEKTDREKERVYYFDLAGIKDIESSWGTEVFCKGLVDSDLLCGDKIKYLAFINGNKGFISMMFETIMISGRKLAADLQIYLHEEDGLDDIVISGENDSAIVRNAVQYCYLRNRTPEFLETYVKEYLSKDYRSENKLILFPFDVIICKEQPRATLFEQYIESISQRPLMATDEAGYLLPDTHMRLGNKVHLKDFYEISILFRKPRIARKIALLIVREMIAGGIAMNQNFLFYGYASYSRAILTSLSEIVKKYQEKYQEGGYFVEFAVYQNDMIVQKTLTHISTKVQMYFSGEIPSHRDVQIIQIVPIISTLTTFRKMWDMFCEYYPKSKTLHLLKNYTLFWVRDRQDPGHDTEPTEIEKEYWDKIEGRSVDTPLIKPNPQFFCCKKIQWYNPLKRKQCYPENVLDEIALVETDATSTVPSQQLEVNLQYMVARNERQQIINEIRMIHLKDCIYYGHISRDGNHFQYYIDTTQYFHNQKECIGDWLHKLRNSSNQEEEDRVNILNIIVTPQHHTNVEFGRYVNDCYFNGNADFITIDPAKEYRSNIVAKYADVKEAVLIAIELGITVKFTYVDDTIITGTTYRRVNNLLHSLIPAKGQSPIQFDHVFVLVNRMSYYSKLDYVKNIGENFHSFVDINISSIRNFGDSCAMCTLQKNSRLFFKRSSTAAISQYWDKKQYTYKAVPFDKYLQLEDCRQKTEQGYFRMLCSHYAKEHMKINADLKESIISILNLILDIERTAQQQLEEERIRPIEQKEYIDYFVSEKLSPIYCCEFKKNVLSAVKSYLKVLCRPFFSYGKIYRQVILDIYLMLTECFLNPDFYDDLSGIKKTDLSTTKDYLNDNLLRDKVLHVINFINNIVPAEEKVNFIRQYLMEGLTDLRSNYIIRQKTIFHYRKLLEDSGENGGRNYLKYVELIHRLVNSSSDETRSLWLEYLLITGEENTVDINQVDKLRVFSRDKKELGFNLFWDSLLIENTRLYYDSMLNFVQKASDFVENDHMEVECAIQKAVDIMWRDYYIKNLRRFVKLEILADSGKKQETDLEHEIRERVAKTASLLYLLKRETSRGISRYDELKKNIQKLLYKDDQLMIFTSAFAGAKHSDELYAVTNYKEGVIPIEVAEQVKKAKEKGEFTYKSYYIGEGYIVLSIDNNEKFLRDENISDPSLVKIQPLYFYIKCKTDNHFRVIFRIRKILMYRHQLLHWIEADFNNNAMTVLAEQMAVNRQLMRDRAGDHNTNTDILTIEKLLQSEYKKTYREVYQWLLLKVYVNMRIARLFRSEWSESYEKIRNKVYTLKKNEEKMNKALVNLGSSIFDDTLSGMSPKNYLILMQDIFCFHIEIQGENLENASIEQLEAALRKLNGRSEENYYYKQEYIVCILFDIFFTAIKFCRNWEIDMYKFFKNMEDENKAKAKAEPPDNIFRDNKAIAYCYILKQEKEKCRITIGTESIQNQEAAYLVLKNRVYGISKNEIAQQNGYFEKNMKTKETNGMSIQAMKWYTETLGRESGVEAKFMYEWNEKTGEVEFVIKLPILSMKGLEK